MWILPENPKAAFFVFFGMLVIWELLRNGVYNWILKSEEIFWKSGEKPTFNDPNKHIMTPREYGLFGSDIPYKGLHLVPPFDFTWLVLSGSHQKYGHREFSLFCYAMTLYFVLLSVVLSDFVLHVIL